MNDEKRPFIQRLFTQIAPRYDWFNRLASFGLDQGWRREALRRGDIRAGQRILDVCAGTGDLAILCAQRQQGRGVVAGADLNAKMLALARRKPPSRRAGIVWLQADAERLPFASQSFDRVLIGFSTRNLSHLMDGIREMMRVLRPQGRLIILETGYPRHRLVRLAYMGFLFTVVRLIGLLLTGRVWPFTYLARSVKQFLTPEEFIERLQRVSAQVQYIPLHGGLASLYLATKTEGDGQ